jgi:putative ABC transport system ATP-binding protein
MKQDDITGPGTTKIEVKDVSLSIHHPSLEVEVLHNVSLSIQRSAIHTLLGPSGSGKSTILYALNRLYKISQGEISLEGKNIQLFNVFELRRLIGLVMQKPVFFPGTVEDNILYGPRLWSKTSKLPDARVFLEMVRLDPDWISRDPSTLSGGQQQRVSLARTLANNPEVLLLDEPTSALDAHASQYLETLITNLCHRQQLTVVWVTHDLNQARRIAQNVTLLYQGNVVENRDAKSFFYQPETEIGRAYLAGKLGEKL